jgi:flagellar biosynthesis/type III secretory pathway chaperone
MMTPAVREDQSPLEAILLDVNATLADLLMAADEQHAAVVADDRARLEIVTRLQERLSSKLKRSERKRLDLLAGQSLADALADLPADQAAPLNALSQSIAQAVRDLQPRHDRNATLLERSAELAGQTVTFLQHLMTTVSPSYSVRGRRAPQQSLLVDSRA